MFDPAIEAVLFSSSGRRLVPSTMRVVPNREGAGVFRQTGLLEMAVVTMKRGVASGAKFRPFPQ